MRGCIVVSFCYGVLRVWGENFFGCFSFHLSFHVSRGYNVLSKGVLLSYSLLSKTCLKLITTPNKVHNWKGIFFFTRGNWGLHPNDPHPSVIMSHLYNESNEFLSFTIFVYLIWSVCTYKLVVPLRGHPLENFEPW